MGLPRDYVLTELVPVALIWLVPSLILVAIPLIAACIAKCCKAGTFGGICSGVYGFVIKIAFPIVAERAVRTGEGKPGEIKQYLMFAGWKEPDNPRSKWMVYTYFVLMAWIVCGWFSVVTWDHLWYRKLYTCNDLTDQDDDHVCFNTKDDFSRVNCREEGDNSDLVVICYLPVISVSMGVGIGFSVAQLVALSIGVAVTIGLTASAICSKKCNCFYILPSVALVVLLLVAVVWPIVSFLADDLNPDYNFFVGHPPLRWVMYGLGILTTICGTLGFMCCLRGLKNEDEYLDMADCEKPESGPDNVNQSQTSQL